MRTRIYRSSMILALLCLTLASVLLSLVFYGQLSSAVRQELRQHAQVFRNDDTESLLQILAGAGDSEVRISLIDRNGAVLFDSSGAAEGMPNHLDRGEVAAALASGSGESRRFSETLGEETYNYALVLADGNILRLSKTASSIFGLFRRSIPAVGGIVLAIAVVAYLLAGRLTRRIVAPMNKMEFEAELMPPYDELAPFVRTISRQRAHIERQMGELRRRSHTIEAIMNSMSEGMILADGQGLVLSVNQSAAAFFGIAAEAVGKNILEIFRNLDLLENVRSALAGKRSEMGMEHEGRAYRVYLSPVQTGGAIILFLDITERLHAEQLRRAFSANVSHELKTPLTSIYGNAQLLHSGMVRPGDEGAFYEKMQDEAARLMALIEDIMLISRLDEGGQSEDTLRESVHLGEVAQAAAQALAEKAAERQVTVQVSGGTVHLRAARSQMYQMFSNLIDNSIKYNRPGGEVRVRISEDEGVRISVSDTGIGIPQASQERVFERFYRVDKSRSKATGGSGLGLAILKHIVLTHGGSIRLESVEGEGTCVDISFAQEE
jgi:PAS domain S-box